MSAILNNKYAMCLPSRQELLKYFSLVLAVYAVLNYKSFY